MHINGYAFWMRYGEFLCAVWRKQAPKVFIYSTCIHLQTYTHAFLRL